MRHSLWQRVLDPHSPFGPVALLGGHRGHRHPAVRPTPSRSLETARPVGCTSALGYRFRDPADLLTP
jgi:hypothetical protein